MQNTQLAVAGGKAAVTIKAPAWPVVGRDEVRWMTEVVKSGKWSWLGQHERAFCQEYSKFVGSKYAIGLANGTVTIQCALQAVGVEPGDEVIVPGMTWCATAQAALDIGADVVLVDIDPETLCIDPKAIEKAITRRTRAIVPVHLYGCMCDMDAIMRIARKHRLKVVEDVAHQHGSEWKGKGAGAIGDAGSFSFQQSKVLTCGEGGAVTTNDVEIYKTVFALKQVGWGPTDPKKSWFDNLAPANRYGHNYRMNEMQAVLLRGGLSRLAAQTALREKRAAQFRKGLESIGGPLRVAFRDPRITRQAYYALTCYYDPARSGGVNKHAFAHALAAEGCHLSGTYWPVYRTPLLNLYDRTSPVPFRDQKKIQNYRDLKLPNTERCVAETALLLGHLHLLGSAAYIDQLLTAVRKVSSNLPAAGQAWEKHQKKAKA
jgi:L-glutamine:2-deoxy-scyllo-inosose/3-amino-2,3-dideoxy-scyllo-inosose aminotransferase